ncbi:sensor histidine kinase [Robinsoniella peoriensis]|uniref:sensor histidine kinase n=1 Tax=Robinsoniella peoriensis TaxID=180332 RepID=UPI003672C618
MKLKRKIMISLIFVSVFAILCSGIAGIIIFKEIMVENAEKLSNNLVKQIAYNLDERIGEFESTSYRIVNFQSTKELLSQKNIEDDSVEYVEKNTNFADTIIQQPSLYQYSRAAILESKYGMVYRFSRSGTEVQDMSDAKKKLNDLRGLVTKSSPIAWTVLDGEIVFVRMIVNDKNFEEKGLLCFFMNQTFFDFIDRGDELLSNENLIITNAQSAVLQNYCYDLENQSLQGIVFDEDKDYFLKNYRVSYENEEYQVTSILSSKKQWHVISLIKVRELMKKEEFIFLAAALIALVSIGFAVLFTWIISKTITRNLTLMEENMKKIEKGDFKARVRPVSYDEIGMLGLQFNYMSVQIENLIDNLAKEKFAKEEAEFNALQAQINPHFLYNTLGSVKWLAHKKNDPEVEKMVDSVISLMRFAIKKTDAFITVEEEVNYIHQYIFLQKAKYGDAFQVVYEVDPLAKEFKMLGFILQPLVENSIYHGIDMSTGEGEIRIKVSAEDHSLVLRIEDNGVGFSEERLDEILHKEKKYKGFNSIGIKIVMERLSAYYKNAYDFRITSEEGEGTKIEIRLPLYQETKEVELYEQL